ncbi:hypothetical protein [Klebsiella aerogenes]|uniref:hypothetical protein n=1 Tax=Klebsiella aerogenes TaxID=548 RepID=UPI0022794029|nr:hypothetical protein [Klebsiella aerogenes]MCY4764344.1 hypothetical protein [Klebsiella aerogenes]
MNKIISSVITGIVFAIVAMLISWIGNSVFHGIHFRAYAHNMQYASVLFFVIGYVWRSEWKSGKK